MTDRLVVEDHHAPFVATGHYRSMKKAEHPACVDDLELGFDRETRRRCAPHNTFGLRLFAAAPRRHRVLPVRVQFPDAPQPCLTVGERAETRHRERVAPAKITQVGCGMLFLAEPR